MRFLLDIAGEPYVDYSSSSNLFLIITLAIAAVVLIAVAVGIFFIIRAVKRKK